MRQKPMVGASSLAAVAMMGACAHWGPPEPETLAAPWSEDDGLEAYEPRYDPDVQIALRLLERLAREHSLSDGRIDVHVENGTVTLLGTVGDPGSRERALDLAESLHGVQAVHNLIDVEAAPAATSPPEDESAQPSKP